MSRTEYSAVVTGPRKIEIQEFEVPKISTEDALLKVEMAGVCASDAKCFQGKTRMDKLPLIMGHEILGYIEEIGASAQQKFKVNKGDRVVVPAAIPCWSCSYCMTGNYMFCQDGLHYGTGVSAKIPPSLWGAYGQYMYLHPNSIVFRVSKDIPAEAAVLASSALSDGIQWVCLKGKAAVGDVVVIQGPGPQGLYATIAARESGASTVIVTGLNRDTERLNLAKEFGANFAINVEQEDVVKFVREVTQGKMADVVLDVTGSPQGVPTAVELVKKQGTVVCASPLGGGGTITLLMIKVVHKEIRLQGVHGSSFESLSSAIKIIESRKYPIEKMVTNKFGLQEAELALKAIGGEVPDMYPIKAVIVPN